VNSITSRSMPIPSPAAGVFQGLEVIGIVRHRLVVAGVFFRRLAPEALGLVVGIVQLRETVGDLLAGDEELEAVGGEPVALVLARQR